MASSAKRPAEPSVDSDGGITEDAAIDWLRREYGLSEGAATLHLKKAWDSGTVRGSENLLEIGQRGETVLRDGKPVFIPPRFSQLITDRFVHDFRLDADDLRWQIEQQLGKPPAGIEPRRRSSSGRRGRPEAPYWPKAHKLIDDWLAENGCPQPGDGNQARLEGEVADHLANLTEELPAESTIRDHVVRRINEQKKNLAEADK